MNRVKAGSRLIEKKQTRLVHLRAGQREQLAQTARKTARLVVLFAAQIELIQKRFDPVV
jgi:hypothetical protein